MILEALRLGVRYCDTAPAYQQSQDYYGEAFRAAGAQRPRRRLPGVEDARAHARSRRCACSTIRCGGSPPIGSTCGRCTTCATWPSSTSCAARAARWKRPRRRERDGRVRFIGLTGHHDPDVLLEAMRRFAFDSVLVSINPADPRHRPFLPTVVAEARRRGMGVVGMKVLAAGRLLREAPAPELHPLRRHARRHGDRRLLQRRRGAREFRRQRRLHADDDRRTARARAQGRDARRKYDYFKAT